MQNIASGWTFKANGVIQYEDDSVEWDYSTGGHFERLLKRCRLCEAKFDFRKLIINQCVGEWTLGLRVLLSLISLSLYSNIGGHLSTQSLDGQMSVSPDGSRFWCFSLMRSFFFRSPSLDDWPISSWMSLM